MKSTYALLAAFLLLAIGDSARSAAPIRHNVLIIVCDDLNRHVGCYGHSEVITPNIDALAERGTRFTRAVSPFPLCNPSRAALLSGVRPMRSGILRNSDFPWTERLPAGHTVMPDHFQRNGYYVFGGGKIHHGETDEADSWDSHMWNCGHDDLDSDESGLVQMLPARVDGEENLVDVETVRYIIEQLDKRPKDKPFMAIAGLQRPHAPRAAPRECFDMYRADQVRLPYSPPDDGADWPAVLRIREQPNCRGLDDATARECILAYHACVTFVDAQVGRLMAALEERGLKDDTIVVFMSDHGYHLGEHRGKRSPQGIWAKGTQFAECGLTPFIVAVPGKPSAVCNQPVEQMGLYATLADLCGLPEPGGVDSSSFAALVDSPEKQWRPAFTQSRSQYSVYTGRFRYTEMGAERVPVMYDHASDPREFRNLIGHPRFAVEAIYLRYLLSNLRAEFMLAGEQANGPATKGGERAMKRAR